ncbi:FG-GAP-like repeat-containing protein, partial [Bacteroidota bacterium]
MKKLICLIVLLLCILNNLKADKLLLISNQKKQKTTKVLMLNDKYYGSTYVVGFEKIASIKEKLELYGYELTMAGLNDTIIACEFGKYNFKLDFILSDVLIDEIRSIEEYDVIMVLPGPDFSKLLENKNAVRLIKEAKEKDKIIVAWCKGVALLAEANIVEDAIIIGNFTYNNYYEKAKADYIKYKLINPEKRQFENVSPPIAWDNIITTVRSLYYRNQMCALIKNAVDRKNGIIRNKIDFSEAILLPKKEGHYSTGIEFADTDKNGWLDIIISNGIDALPQPISIINNSIGNLSDNVDWYSDYKIPAGNIFVSDLNADELPDISVSYLGLSQEGFQPGNHVVFINQDGYKKNPDWLSLPANGFSNTGGDFDGDGDMDLV